MPNHHNRQDGFRLMRRPTNLEWPAELAGQTTQVVDGHILYAPSRIGLDLIRRRDAKSFMNRSKSLDSTPLAKIIEKTFSASPESAHDPIELATKRLQFVKGPFDERYRIDLFLDDPEGVIVSEREVYLHALERLSGAKTKKYPFHPRLELGRVQEDLDPSLDVLRLLMTRLPEFVTLDRVEPFPDPKILKGPGLSDSTKNRL